MGWLIYKDAAGKQQKVEIAEAPLVCGRSERAAIHFAGSTLSRRHVIFVQRGGRDWVKDAGSRNGTLLNDHPLHKAAPLRDGDLIALGDHRIIYAARDPNGQGIDEDTSLVVTDESGAEEPATNSTMNSTVPAAAAPTAASPSSSSSSSRPALAAAASPSPPAAQPPTAAPALELAALFRDSRRWRQVTLVGRGGMGEVYRAYDRDLGTLVAVKCLRHRRGEIARLLERLHAREASIGRSIRHANVVRVLEDGIHEGDPFLLLEWVEGRTLDKVLRAGTLPFGEALEILRQIALGLAAAHASGVVHADMKPANVLLMEEPAAREPECNLDMLEDPEEDLEPSRELSGELIDEITRRLGGIARPDFSEPAPFAGREGELSFLQQLASRSRALGRSAWVVIVGGAGVGKRRLIAEFAKRIVDTPLTVTEDPTPPATAPAGLHVTLLTAPLPEEHELFRAYEEARKVGLLNEIHLQPFLRGQAIHFVEQMVHHRSSARQFIDCVEEETAGLPQRILEVLKRSFEQGAWNASGGCHRFDASIFRPDEHEVARLRIARLEGEEKGFRDFLVALSGLGSCIDFESMLAASGFDRESVFYLANHAVKEGYLARSRSGIYHFPSDPFRRTLERRQDAAQRRKRNTRALPLLTKRLEDGDAPHALYADVANLEREVGRLERAFQWYVEGSLAAREAYDRASFVQYVDEARELFRMGEGGQPLRAAQQILEKELGPAGRGLGGIERLRRLPLHVRVKLSDFGVSRRSDDAGNGDESLAWGTPRYMSPEQARRGNLTSASDIYSLGIIARELFEGKHPLGDLRAAGAHQAILEGVASNMSNQAFHLPEDLRHLLREMLESKPEGRPRAKEIARRLQNLQLRQDV